jgi:hypothetical protein
MSVQTASYIEAIEHLPTGATLRIPHVRWEDYDQLLALGPALMAAKGHGAPEVERTYA